MHAVCRHLQLLIVVLTGLALTASAPYAAEPKSQTYPDVLAAKVRARSAGIFDFDVTISSPYDTPQRYADAFHVKDRNGTIFGERALWHDHASEQPFTRDLYGVKIPSHVRTVIIQARDRKNGYGGKTVEVSLPAR